MKYRLWVRNNYSLEDGSYVNNDDELSNTDDPIHVKLFELDELLHAVKYIIEHVDRFSVFRLSPGGE